MRSSPFIIATIRRAKSLNKLDSFGLSLANEGHFWTIQERKEFNKKVRELSK